jgi:transposase-like protein
VKSVARSRLWSPPRSAFAGFRFPAEVIVVAVRWYLRYGLSYRDVEELLAERGIDVHHVTVYRGCSDSPRCWPTPPGSAATRRVIGGSSTRRTSKSTACGATSTEPSTSTARVIDVLLSHRRDAAAARRLFARALRTLKVIPSEVFTDAAPVYPGVLEELPPSAWHHVEQYANNPIEADHGQLKHRLRSMRGLQTDRTAQVIVPGSPSYRICDAATTTSHLILRRPHDSPPPSPNSLEPSDQQRPRASTRSANRQCNGASYMSRRLPGPVHVLTG